MLKRTFFFSSPVMLNLCDNQLVLHLKEAPEEKRTFPVEDIGVVVLEHPMIHITLPRLNALSENNVAVVICDRKQMPSSMLLCLDSGSVQGELFRYQTEAGEALKKNLWKQIIEVKIENQARLLDKTSCGGDVLKPVYKSVKSGDSTNREAVAAKIYWELLFGPGFVRCREGQPPNNLLNYGYTILRAATARALMGSGLLPALGIFHRNRYNAFPLADDVMEGYRPYVDECVYDLYFSGHRDLTKEVKTALLGVLFADTVFRKVTRPLEIGLTITTASLAKCFAGKQKKLSYPSIT